jgi:hypothetical protein
METDLKEGVPRCELDASGSELGPMTDSSKRDDTPAGSITYVDILTRSATTSS